MRTRERMPAELRRALTEVFGPAADEVVLRERSLFARLHRGVRATTRRNTIYLRGSLDEFFADPELMLHEYFHVLRQWNRGRMTLWRYLVESWHRGYWQNRYERQARRFARMRLAAFRRAVPRLAAGRPPARTINLLGSDPNQDFL
jgi:hypothetical protein